MATDLLDKRSRSPTKLYSQRLSVPSRAGSSASTRPCTTTPHSNLSRTTTAPSDISRRATLPSTHHRATNMASGRPSTTATCRNPYRKVSASSRQSNATSLQFYSSIQTLEIESAQFHCQQNSSENHTKGLEATECEVVLRRGNTLILKITTSLAVSGDYVVTLTFVPVFRPRDRFGQFRADGVAKGSQNLWLSIAIPPTFPVGKYHAHITLSVKSRVEITTYFHNKAVVILFNPWNNNDDTYLKSDLQKQVYLLNDVGIIWRGSEANKVPLHWQYGQYEEHCLDVALFLLRSLTADECRSASSVSRCLISSVNSRDNSGVLAGSSGSHMGGTHPCRWTGSTAILSKFYRTKMPVRFGQCWVFAGVAVSMLRALGIPCRPVTCYNAAHCVQKLGKVDRYFSAEGDLIASIGRDQIWVYHVWCEAWMRRDDLPRGYDGWQVLDATSQDRQSGRYRIGPASVVAIKNNQSSKKWPYDVEYVRSQLTADVCYYRVTSSFSTASNQAFSLASVGKGEVGTCLVTSSYTNTEKYKPLTLTADYREPIVSAEPAEASRQQRGFPYPPARDCSFDLALGASVNLGEDIEISVTVANNGAMLRTVDGKLVGTAVYYTGQPVRSFMSLDFSGLVSPGQSAAVKLPIEAKKYMRNLVEQGILQFFVVVKVRETKQLFLKVEPYQLVLPKLGIQCPSTITQGGTFRIKISFTNILHRSLTRVLFLVQGQALCPQRELSHKRLVLPGAVASVDLTLNAHCVGSFQFLVSMFCDQLTDVRGHANINIIEQSSS